MRKEELIKKIVEDPKFREKYWPKFEINNNINDYKYPIIRSKNPYLISLYELMESNTQNILFKKILKNFKL